MVCRDDGTVHERPDAAPSVFPSLFWIIRHSHASRHSPSTQRASPAHGSVGSKSTSTHSLAGQLPAIQDRRQLTKLRAKTTPRCATQHGPRFALVYTQSAADSQARASGRCAADGQVGIEGGEGSGRGSETVAGAAEVVSTSTFWAGACTASSLQAMSDTINRMSSARSSMELENSAPHAPRPRPFQAVSPPPRPTRRCSSAPARRGLSRGSAGRGSGRCSTRAPPRARR